MPLLIVKLGYYLMIFSRLKVKKQVVLFDIIINSIKFLFEYYTYFEMFLFLIFIK